ncbi:hypothetical protein BDQ12DRAFT_689578 [Crucibulum laeve]|uniref:Uncharacterized protein n=1 Tax=Crucibulum laeve TaxID=68775 RepID=A0A5C3M0T7_9AGAR|nr:hypothetical protein BDQ12DRAFT_689578 [Crucibulum laeve]
MGALHVVDVSALCVGIIQPYSLTDCELVATAIGIKYRQDGGDGPLDVGAGFAEFYVD